MANPFGGSGETLSKNTGHANQGNLICAVVPRSTTVIREVINGVNLTINSGTFQSYDADGYLRGATGAGTAIASYQGTFTNIGQTFTIIAGMRVISGQSDVPAFVGLENFGESGNIKAGINGYQWGSSVSATVDDWFHSNAYNSASADASTNAYVGMGVTSNGTTNVQKACYVSGTSTPPTGARVDVADGALDIDSHNLNLVRISLSSRYAFQYLFVYNTDLTPAQIEAIIEDPGSVLSLPVTTQIVAPTSDISAGNWVRSSDGTGTGLYTMLDESAADDADYVYVNSDSTMEVKFASVSDPATSTGHKVKYRIKGNGVATITVSLRQGSSTEIASWTHTAASTITTTHEQTLTSGQADSITDYADLRLRFVTFTP